MIVKVSHYPNWQPKPGLTGYLRTVNFWLNSLTFLNGWLYLHARFEMIIQASLFASFMMLFGYQTIISLF